MTPNKRVEEMVINFKHWYEGHPYEKPDRQKIMNYLRKELPNTLTQHHQDLMSEVMEKLEGMKYKGEPSADASDLTWAAHHEHNNTLTEAQTIIKVSK